ncbi:hypothetical protein B0I37DRAFT_421479 [Chaetomium sp. MPI-CAGE-AT-0009]|nr:hypothetical protein B0I37DRAFT_421479 [Chaetomium sp. MPI-CAGE-AT-0009]
METVFYPPHPGLTGGSSTALASPTWLYWIDPSCDEASNGNFEVYVFKARHWAQRAYERLTSKTDTDFARVFSILFKVPLNDTVRYPMSPLWQSLHGREPQSQWRTSAENVLGVLYNFAHCWKRTYERKEADVRVYLTNLAETRWVANGPREAIDPVNYLVVPETPAGLLEANTAVTICDARRLPIEGENPRRCVIELDPELWGPAAGEGGFLKLPGVVPSLLLGEDSQGDGVRAPLDPPRRVSAVAEDLIEIVLFHEFMHIYLLHDYADKDGTISGWHHCMRHKRGQAPVCAESLAMLGLWAALADMKPPGKPSGGFSLSREWCGTSEDLYDEDGRVYAYAEAKCGRDQEGIMSAIRGELIFYEDLTN